MFDHRVCNIIHSSIMFGIFIHYIHSTLVTEYKLYNNINSTYYILLRLKHIILFR